jgi:NADPH-dependent 2,4-dienoyl-CoA reductase/sulfur reductase-like enzyme
MDRVEFECDGRRLDAPAGHTVAAALMAAGIRAFRRTMRDEPRGVFCGMGVCFDCLVTIDGVPHQRACMTELRAGMRIARGEPLAPYPSGPAPRLPERERAPDLLVIGGGPAGLAAAAAAAEAGVSVLLVDERPKLGGQFFKQPAAGVGLPAVALDRQFRDGRAAIERARNAGVDILSGTTVWGVFGREEIAAVAADATYLLRPKRLVLATGAYEIGVPLPGWTLPGCMTTGAAQTLLRSYGVSPGRRVLVSGNGPLNFQVASELLRVGVEVAALAEAAPPPLDPVPLATMAATAPDLVRDGIKYVLALRRAGVPIFHRHAVVRIEGDGRTERAILARIDETGRAVLGTEKRFDVDAVCIGFGFLASNEAARSLGCRHRYDAARGQLVAECDGNGRSSVDGVWIVGDGAGLGGARLAQAMGVLAGLDVARDLGRSVSRHAREIDKAQRACIRARRFQTALWRLFRAPLPVEQLARPETPICRCEGVSLADVEAALDKEIEGLGAIKRLTRAGMGWCQGRYCGRLIAEIAARRTGRPIDELTFFAPRMPLKPVAIASAAPPEVAG